MRLSLSVIVEGPGDVEAVPVLVRRLAERIDPDLSFDIAKPIRAGKTRLRRSGELERFVDLAARKLQGTGAVLILIDADDDCPKELGAELLERARRARGDTPIRTVLAKKEFEAWLVAAADSLQGKRGLPEELEPPAKPEEIRGAKEWLSERIQGRRYRETLDQAAFASIVDLDGASRAPSFLYLMAKLRELVGEVTPEAPTS